MLSPFDSFIFSTYLVFIFLHFSLVESHCYLWGGNLRRVEDSTTSYDGRVDCNIETAQFVSGCVQASSPWIGSTYADWLGQTNVGTNSRWSGGVSFSLSISWLPWWRRCLVSLMGGGLKCNCHQNWESCRAVLKLTMEWLVMLLAKEKGVCTCL